jgi:hypothetical protein
VGNRNNAQAHYGHKLHCVTSYQWLGVHKGAQLPPSSIRSARYQPLFRCNDARGRGDKCVYNDLKLRHQPSLEGTGEYDQQSDLLLWPATAEAPATRPVSAVAKSSSCVDNIDFKLHHQPSPEGSAVNGTMSNSFWVTTTTRPASEACHSVLPRLWQRCQ